MILAASCKLLLWSLFALSMERDSLWFHRALNFSICLHLSAYIQGFDRPVSFHTEVSPEAERWLFCCNCSAGAWQPGQADIEKQITFPVIPVAEKAAAASFEEALVPVILGHLRLFAEGGYVLQQMVKFSKFGADPAGRVRNDPRLGGLGTYLKQFDQFCASKAKLAKLMAELPETSDKQTLVGLDIPNLAAFQITADMLSAIRSVLEGWHKEATSSRARLSDITNDKHLPGTSWKEELSDKADFKTVQTHVAIKMDDDMSALPEAIKTLQEVASHGDIHVSESF